MLIVELAMFGGICCLRKMVASTAFATRRGWSICPGIPWSVCPGIGGQLAPESGGLVHQNLHIGSRIVDEALNRGHDVTAVVRHPENYTKIHEHLKVAKGDLFNSQDVETGAFNQDAVVSAYSPAAGTPASTITDVAIPLINGLKQAHVKRLVIVGGAGSLEVAPGKQLVDTPDFPEAYKPVSLAHREALKIYQKQKDLDWTFACPSAEIMPGERTGKFRTETNELLTAADGKSSISMEDFAVAIMDEIETPMHIQSLFTVGY